MESSSLITVSFADPTVVEGSSMATISVGIGLEVAESLVVKTSSTGMIFVGIGLVGTALLSRVAPQVNYEERK